MNVRQLAFLDERQRILKHLFRFGREAGDEIGPEHDIGPRPLEPGAEADRVGAAVAALHSLQDHIVARLQRKMKMRHQSRLVGDHLKQIRFSLDAIDRREPQPGEQWRRLQDRFDEFPEVWRAGEIPAVGGKIDAGQHDLFGTFVEAGFDRRESRVDRHRARCAAPIRNNAECAAMIAAVLHREKGAGAALDAGAGRQSRSAPKNVADFDAPLGRKSERLHLLGIAENPGDFGHCREHFGIDLRGAAGDDDVAPWGLALEPADRLPRLANRFAPSPRKY